jgi:hypothetical protein
VIGVAIASLAACGATASTVYYPANSSVTATPGVGIGDGAPTYISQFRQQFPALAEGKTDEQILRDGEADCSDMAAAGKLTTASTANRYGLRDSTADQFTLYNIALLATFTLCGPADARARCARAADALEPSCLT